MTGPVIVISGTDTDVGKTVFAAALTAALGASYWKPIQAGMEAGGDSATVAALGGIPDDRIIPEAYRLATPCSPDRAAALDGIAVDPDRLVIPDVSGPLVIEGAGGLLVPIVDDFLFIDLFKRWKQPVVLVARTTLGTINHSLLSIEALHRRKITIKGIAFVGDSVEHSEATIARVGGVRHLGRLPFLPALNGSTLAEAFAANFDVGDFA